MTAYKMDIIAQMVDAGMYAEDRCCAKDVCSFELHAAIVSFTEDDVVISVDEELRSMKRKPYFSGLQLFVGMEIVLLLKEAVGWSSCELKYYPSEENSVMACS